MLPCKIEHSVATRCSRAVSRNSKKENCVLGHQSRMERKFLKSDQTLHLGKLDTGRDLL